MPRNVSVRDMDDQLRRLVWAIRAASQVVPGSNCLSTALAGQFMCARAGYRTQIRIGVASGSEDNFRAHAWLVNQERVILGGPATMVRTYVRLAEFDIAS